MITMVGSNSVHHINNKIDKNILKVSNLNVRGRDTLILDRINFEVKKGTILAIVGPNGAGKTTLFRALLNLIPYSGSVEWSEGVRMGYVPQGLITTDIPVTVREFLNLKCKVDPTSCLAAVGLEEKILDMQLGKLSGGQLQRVLLAWSIVDNPDILLYDEPTSGVDVGAEEPIYEKIVDMKNNLGITVLLITHNHHVVLHYSDYILSINRKQVYYGETKNIDHDAIMDVMSGYQPGKDIKPVAENPQGE